MKRGVFALWNTRFHLHCDASTALCLIFPPMLPFLQAILTDLYNAWLLWAILGSIHNANRDGWVLYGWGGGWDDSEQEHHASGNDYFASVGAQEAHRGRSNTDTASLTGDWHAMQNRKAEEARARGKSSDTLNSVSKDADESHSYIPMPPRHDTSLLSIGSGSQRS